MGEEDLVSNESLKLFEVLQALLQTLESYFCFDCYKNKEKTNMESIKLVENDNSLRITIEDKLDCDKSPRATLLEKEQIDGKMDKKYFDMEKEAKNAEKTDSSDEWEDLDEPLSATRQWLDKRHQGLCAFLNNNSSQIRNIVIVLCMLAFAVYFVFALRHNYRDEGELGCCMSSNLNDVNKQTITLSFKVQKFEPKNVFF